MGIARVLQGIEAACARAGRNPAEVRLVAVTKGHPLEEIQERVLQQGVFRLGESRVQEALPKMKALAQASPTPIEWHFIGPLQRNKAKFAVAFDLIHSVDSLRLAEALGSKALEGGKLQPVLIEVNLSREPQKHGLLEEELGEALPRIRAIPGLEVRGLMTIAPYTDQPQSVRPVFAQLSRLADRFGLPERSMGMSGDFEVAVEEGATLVRVGTAVFQSD
ncbi:MAG: YggS family pyridoxal phosphate-dependent enzyme [Thermaceae bacterium]|nr:YggS family pyridoxal phosphate-dependent enzyme [Thermaceae bacterium]